MAQHEAAGPAGAGPGRLTSRPGPARTPSPPPRSTTEGLVRLPLPSRQPPLLLVPGAAEGPRPLVVFFHGAGGHGQGSLGSVEAVAAERGLLVLLPTSAGATWDLVTGPPGQDVAALDLALAEVFSAYDVDRVAFAGFSDGGSYALSIGLANGDLGEAVLAFSPGFAAPPSQVGAPRVFVAHGDADAVLPVARCGRRVARTLDGAGYDVRYEEFAGGHVVPPRLVDAAVDWWLADAGG
ncbi:alpha/beta hydrolase [Cellulomonas aerilata]|nr:phospholipase [Cellulomonas aerilata]